jgi:hypothetical protein
LLRNREFQSIHLHPDATHRRLSGNGSDNPGDSRFVRLIGSSTYRALNGKFRMESIEILETGRVPSQCETPAFSSSVMCDPNSPSLTQSDAPSPECNTVQLVWLDEDSWGPFGGRFRVPCIPWTLV